MIKPDNILSWQFGHFRRTRSLRGAIKSIILHQNVWKVKINYLFIVKCWIVLTAVKVLYQLKTFELFQKSESEILEIFICLSWQLAVKVRGSTYCYWDEKFRNQQWKCELWAHARWTTCTCQHHAASIREIWGTLDLIFTFPGMQVTTIGITFCLVLSCFIFTIPLSSVALPSSRILDPVDQNIPQNWQIQSYSPD